MDKFATEKISLSWTPTQVCF